MSIDREIIMLEKQLNEMKAKLNNAIIDMRVVHFWGWYHQEWDGFSVPKPEKKWAVLRYEIQYKRQGDPNWVAIPIVDRDDIDPTVPNGELDE